MPERIDPDKVQMWLERLHSESEQDRSQAASELNRMHVQVRGTVRVRGSLSQAARSELDPLTADAIKQIQTALQDPSPAVRREVAAALGEWSDAAAVKSLYGMVKEGPDQDTDASVRRACVRALGIIGGPVAVEGLCAVAEHDTDEAVRRDAINVIIELALQEPEERKTLGKHSSLRNRVSATLEHIGTKKEEKEYLRRRTKVGLTILAGA